MRIRPALVASLTVLALGATAACSSEPDTTPTDAVDSTTPSAPAASSSAPAPGPGDTSAPASPTEEPEPAGPVIAVTIAGDEISPIGELVELGLGEELTFEITSDRAGEFHVHSKPDQYVEFEAGTSSQTITVDVPGSIEVEDHDTGDLIAQLQVR